MYGGIKEDPLGKTNELYHMRTKIDRDRENFETSYTEYYYRVSDLVQVYVHDYTKMDDSSEIVFEGWEEHLDGGRTEYQGTFTKSDFHLPGCTYTIASSFLE
jgi:hypothetical protein